MKNKIIIICFLALLIFVLYFFVNPKKYSDNKFGVNYNNFRIENNVPTLSGDWLSRNNMALFECYNKDTVSLGHIKKYINLSKSITGSERDIFKLDKIIIVSLFERNDNNKVLYKIENPNNDSINIFQMKKEVIGSDEANELLEDANINFRFNKSWDR